MDGVCSMGRTCVEYEYFNQNTLREENTGEKIFKSILIKQQVRMWVRVNLAQNRTQWRVLINMVMNLWVP
jgi:hypothetical protein